MKLWKTLKLSSASKTNEAKTPTLSLGSSNQTVDTIELEERWCRSTSESPDSGLPGEKPVRRVTVQLDRRRGKDLGFILAGRSEPGLLPTIAGFKKESAAHDADRFAPGDKITSINGIATARLTNDEVLALLDNVEERASLEVEYYLPNYDSQSSLCITTKVAQVNVEKVDGSLGITLRGGETGRSGDAARGCGLGVTRAPGPLLVTHVRPGGPAHSTARIKPGDRLIKVDNISLANKTLAEAHQILQNSPPVTNLTIEYDISIMESVKFATGPLLIEIEKGCNESLGILLTDKSYNEECFGGSSQHSDSQTGIYIDNIVPASISDRCGALHPGDQLLAVDDLIIENSSYTPDEVMCYIENCSAKGFTQLQIYPVHMLLKNYRMTKGKQPGSPISGMSTLNSRKSHRQNRTLRQSSLPKSFDIEQEFHHNNFVTGVGVCRSEVLSLQLDIPPNHDSGITVCDDRELLLISHITHQSPAYRSGCLQLGDRILSVNSQQNLTAQAANEILQKRNDSMSMRYLNIKTEFSLADSVEASSGVFNVKLAKYGAGLGITITGNKQRSLNTEEPMIISHIKPGSVAYRSGTLAIGDHLIAIDSQPLSNLSLDAAFNILQNFPDDIITLTVKKTDRSNDWGDVRHANSSKSAGNYAYSLMEPTSSINSSVKSGSTYAPSIQMKNQYNLFNNGGHDIIHEASVEKVPNDGYYIFDLELIKNNDGPLGLTIAGSEDASQPIVISGLVKGGLAEVCGSLQIGDRILFINGENIQQKPLSDAIKILQNSPTRVVLKILRSQMNGPSSDISTAIKTEKADPYDNRDSSTFTNNSQSSPGLASIDSAVESWDSQPIICNRDTTVSGMSESSEQAINCNPDSSQTDGRVPYLPTDENKLLASGYKVPESTVIQSNDLPMPNYSFTNTLRTFKSEPNNTILVEQHNCGKVKFEDRANMPIHNVSSFEIINNNNEENDIYTPNNGNMFNKPLDDGGTTSKFNITPLQFRTSPFQMTNDDALENGSNRSNNSFVNTFDNQRLRRQYEGQRNMLNIPNYQMSSNNYQLNATQNYDSDFLNFYNMESLANKGTIHHVILFKDAIYDDYGFSVSDGLYERGVYINRIRKGGPADIVGLLRPFDRILQVNGTRTVDFDCCLTVPLIASAGDRIELVLQRLKDGWNEDSNSNILEQNNIITKTI